MNYYRKNTTIKKKIYRKEEMEDIQGAANVRRQEIRTQGRAYEKLIDNSLSSLIQKEGFSTSKYYNRMNRRRLLQKLCWRMVFIILGLIV